MIQLLQKRRAGARTAVTILISTSLLVAAGCWTYLNLVEPNLIQASNEENNLENDIVEEQSNSVQISNISDAVRDLESRGCQVINVTAVEGYSDGVGFKVEYDEFLKVALKKGLAVLYQPKGYTVGVLLVPYENSFFVWLPETEPPTYTQFEKIEITTAIAQKGPQGWEISVKLRNSGSAATTLTHAFINDVPLGLVKGGNTGIAGDEDAGERPIAVNAAGCSIDKDGLQISPGSSAEIKVYIGNNNRNLTSGTTINLKLHSAGGMDYIKLVRLP